MTLSSIIAAHRTATYAVFSTALIGLVILNAFRKHSNFYAIAVYLSRSSGSVMALANFGLLMTLLFGNVCQQIFFGPLRPVETERLYDRMWFFVTESLLAFTIFRDEFDTTFVMMFMILLFLKCFHWIVADRIDWMDQVPYPGPPMLFHIRTSTLLNILGTCDILLIGLCADDIAKYGVGWTILFASEYAILLASVLNSWMKYSIACYDLLRARSRGAENAPVWEDKSMYIFYVELVTDFLKLITYLVFFAVVMTYYGLPLNVIRDVYITARSFLTRVRDLVRYRSATRNMDEKYPNATEAELGATSDRTCIICREEMLPAPPTAPRAAPAHTPGPVQAAAAPLPQEPAPSRQDGPNETPKKLPCGHIFHFHCLRSWLERQQSCPTCRRSVLERDPPPPATAQTPAPAAPAPGAAPQPPAPGVGGNPNQDELIAQANALIARLRGQGQGGNANPTAYATTSGDASGSGPASTSTNAQTGAKVFPGFMAGGVWHPWNNEPPEPTPTLTAVSADDDVGLPATGATTPKLDDVALLASSEPTASTTDPSAPSSEIPAPSTTPLATPPISTETATPVVPEAPTPTLTPREAAARAAILRASGGRPNAGLDQPTTSSPSTEETKPAIPTPTASTSTPSAPKRSRSFAPRLIPLFDPSAIPAGLTCTTSIPYTAPFVGFPFTSSPSFAGPLPMERLSALGTPEANDPQTRLERLREKVRIVKELQSSISDELTTLTEDVVSITSVKGKEKDIGIEA